MSRDEVTKILKGSGETEYLVSRPEGSRRLVSYPGLGWFLYRQERLIAVAPSRASFDAHEPLETWISDCKALESFPEDHQEECALSRWNNRHLCCLLFWDGAPSPEVLEPIEVGMTFEQVRALAGPPPWILKHTEEEIWRFPNDNGWVLATGRAVGFRGGRVVWMITPPLIISFGSRPEPSPEEQISERARELGYIPTPSP